MISSGDTEKNDRAKLSPDEELRLFKWIFKSLVCDASKVLAELML
jgi:hypothetical protein